MLVIAGNPNCGATVAHTPVWMMTMMAMSTMAKPPRMPATVMPVLFFLDATTVSSSRTVR